MRKPGDDDIPVDPAQMIRIGTVKTIDLGEATCTVEYGDDEGDMVESPPVAWGEWRTGETRSWSPPSVGEQVILLCPDGEIAAGIAMRGIFRDTFPPPGNSLRELIQFKDGAVLAYDPEAHKLEAILPGGGEITLTGPGKVTINAQGGAVINGPVEINGDVTLNGKMTASDDVIASGKSLKSHKHGGVQAGGGQTGGPI